MGRRGYKMHSKVVWPGFSNAPAPRQVVKVGRNEPCPCGSGKKYKECHEREGSAYLERLAVEQEKERRRQARRDLKAQGVPWYKRLLLRG